MKAVQAFVSHTSDMARSQVGRSFAQAALDGVSRAGMVPVDMRYFAARDREPADYCRQRVRECDVYIAVVGFQYGSVAPGEGACYTELEFREAGVAGMPRLIFLQEEAAGLSSDLADADRGPVEGFRQRLRDAGLIARSFTSADSLELEVFHALRELDDRRPPTPAAAATRTLPHDIASFIGRQAELAQLASDTAVQAGGVVGIHAIGGMAGVGKTAFAVHAAPGLPGASRTGRSSCRCTGTHQACGR